MIWTNCSVVEYVASPVTIVLTLIASSTGIGDGDMPFVSTCQDSCGIGTSLSGPVTLQVMLKFSPAVGTPGMVMSTVNRKSTSSMNQNGIVDRLDKVYKHSPEQNMHSIRYLSIQWMVIH